MASQPRSAEEIIRDYLQPSARKDEERFVGPSFFFFEDTATAEIYTLSLHDALPIWAIVLIAAVALTIGIAKSDSGGSSGSDRKSTRLNSSHPSISYAVFCLKKKTNNPFLIIFTKKKKK